MSDSSSSAPLSGPAPISSGPSLDSEFRDSLLHPVHEAPYFRAMQFAVLAFLCAQFLILLADRFLPSPPPTLRVIISLLPLHSAAVSAFLITLSGTAERMGILRTLQWLPSPDSSPSRMPFLLRLFLLTASALVTAMATHALARALNFQPQSQHIMSLFQHSSSPLLKLIIALAAVLLAPISEELLFRLGLYESLGNILPPSLQAIATAFLFALAHGQLITLPPLFVVGLFLQQAKKTGGLKLSMSLHAAYNALQLGMVFVLE